MRNVLDNFRTLQFEFEDADCNPNFAARIKKAFAQLNLEDRKQFTRDLRDLYLHHRRDGWGSLMKKLARTPVFVDLIEKYWYGDAEAWFTVTIGQNVIDILGQEKIQEYFPHNHFFIRATYTGFSVRCMSLDRTNFERQNYYYSFKKPKLTIDGKERLVAFSKHAIQQICERITAGMTRYRALSETFIIVHAWTYFEDVTLHYSQPGFSLYNRCTPAYPTWRYVEELLGTVDATTPFFYRLGYCPVVENSEFFLAKTLLCPGYKATPEYGLLLKANMPNAQKDVMLAQCEKLSNETMDFTLLKWFHNNSIEQVKTIDTDVFGIQW